MNSYELYRKFFDWCFENPHKVTPSHVAIYCFAIEHCNRLGWKTNFGLPTTMVMEAVGIKSYNTYIKCFNELVEYGFIKLVEKSKNQYSANIIALSKFNKALDKALDKAMIKHKTKQRESIEQSIDSINKPINNNTNLPINQFTIDIEQQAAKSQKSTRFIKPSLLDIEVFTQASNLNLNPEQFFDFYESKDWFVGKNKMKDWKAAARNWARRNQSTPQNQNQSNIQTQLEYEKQHINADVFKHLRGFERTGSISTRTLEVARHYLSQTTTRIDVLDFAGILDKIENEGGIPDQANSGIPLRLGLGEAEQFDNHSDIRLLPNDTREFND